MPSALQTLLAKQLMPTILSSAELEALDKAITERSIFAAGCDHLRIVQSIRDGARGIVSGEATNADARRTLREALNYYDYKLAPGREGTISDLRNIPRQKLIVDMNVRQVRNYAWRESLLAENSDKKVAWELIRVGRRQVPRDWDGRWMEAVRQLTPEERRAVSPNGKIALITSRIWSILSRFKTPYPPFDYNSGMGVRVVSGEGLVDTSSPKQEGLNEQLSSSLSGVDDDLKDWVSKNLSVTVTINGESATIGGER